MSYVPHYSWQVLRNEWQRHGPFDGLLGFSNGAAAAFLLACRAVAEPVGRDTREGHRIHGACCRAVLRGGFQLASQACRAGGRPSFGPCHNCGLCAPPFPASCASNSCPPAYCPSVPHPLVYVQASFPGLKFVIVAGGYVPQPLARLVPPPFASAPGHSLPPQPLPLDSLHFYSEADVAVAAEDSLALAGCFRPTGRCHVPHDMGHCMPQKAAHCTAVMEFVQGAMGGGRGSAGGGRAVAGEGGRGRGGRGEGARNGAEGGRGSGRGAGRGRGDADPVVAALSGLGLGLGARGAAGSEATGAGGRGAGGPVHKQPHAVVQGGAHAPKQLHKQQQQQQDLHPNQKQQQKVAAAAAGGRIDGGRGGALMAAAAPAAGAGLAPGSGQPPPALVPPPTASVAPSAPAAPAPAPPSAPAVEVEAVEASEEQREEMDALEVGLRERALLN